MNPLILAAVWARKGWDGDLGPAVALTVAERDWMCARIAELEQAVTTLREVIDYDSETRRLFLAAWANLTRDVAPLIASFRGTPAKVSEEQVDQALVAMAEMQRVEARIGVHYFDRKAALAATAALVPQQEPQP